MKSHFYALLSRMKYINRWGLMHSSRPENLSEHTMDTAFIIHALIAIHNNHFGGNLSEGEAVLYALYHDCSEIITGDMPTPVKYHNKEMRAVYHKVEETANQTLLKMLPPSVKSSYLPYLTAEADNRYYKFIKAADKLSALIKCIEEEKLGNQEFSDAYASTLSSIKSLCMPEADYFLENCIPSYRLTLDKLQIKSE